MNKFLICPPFIFYYIHDRHFEFYEDSSMLMFITAGAHEALWHHSLCIFPGLTITGLKNESSCIRQCIGREEECFFFRAEWAHKLRNPSLDAKLQELFALL